MVSVLQLMVVGDKSPAVSERAEDDAALIRAFLLRGSNEHFERLVDRYKDRVFRLVSSVMGPRFSAEAEDITQEVFIQVYRKLSTFRMRSRFATWLYRIAYNRALERKQKARFRLPHQSDESLSAMAAPEDQADPAARAVTRQRREQVHRCIEELAEPYRTAIYLHYWMKSPVSEIAEHLGTKPGTVKSYLYRGRERLARKLKEGLEDE